MRSHLGSAPTDFDIESGGEVELSTIHTRQFNPEHIDGPPFFVGMVVKGTPTRELDGVYVKMTANEALAIGNEYIRRAVEIIKLNRNVL